MPIIQQKGKVIQRQKHMYGFTLFEMMVAIAVFAILSAIVATGLNTTLKLRDAIKNNTTDIVALQQAFLYLQRDLSHILNRPSTDSYGERQPALLTELDADERIIEFSRFNWPNPAEQAKSDLARVAYGLIETETEYDFRDDKTVYTLYRWYWRAIDRALDEPNRRRKLVEGIYTVDIEYLDDNGQWHTQWPAPNASSPGTGPTPLPKAIAFDVDTEKWGQIRRIFRILGGKV